jgi:transposase-like protein
MTTSNKSHKISKEVKDQILQRIKEEGISVSQAASEHGISTRTIYGWLTRGVSGNPTWTQVAKLKKQNKALLELVGQLTVNLSNAQKKS